MKPDLEIEDKLYEANVYRKEQEYDIAIEKYIELYQIVKNSPQYYQQYGCEILKQLCFCYRKEKNIDSALMFINEAIKLANKNSLKFGNNEETRTNLAICYMNKGVIFDEREIYDIAMEQSAFEAETAREDYEKAVGKREEFDSVIREQVISAVNSGVVMEVYAAAGDYLSQDMDLISLNNYDEVTITVSVEEGDLEAAALGNAVNVTLAAFEDEVFAGTVTKIGDAEIDSNTNKTMYSITVTVPNTDRILYQDMTAEVTFVTDQVSEVLYVPVRAVTEEDGANYVKVRGEDGTAVRKKVITGFADGVNIEIKEGLSEGETVLIESKGKG